MYQEGQIFLPILVGWHNIQNKTKRNKLYTYGQNLHINEIYEQSIFASLSVE